jgi:hypothetical protein
MHKMQGCHVLIRRQNNKNKKIGREFSFMIKQVFKTAVAVSFYIAGFMIPAYAENAKPLGYEVGVASYETVYNSLKAKTQVNDLGLNKFTQGKVLKVSGSSFNIRDSGDISFIFDQEEKLSGVLMSLPKSGTSGDDYYYSGFYQSYNDFQRKYTLVKQSLPVVGHLFAQFRKGESTIEMDAPEASETFDVRYLSPSFIQSYQSINRQKFTKNPAETVYSQN